MALPENITLQVSLNGGAPQTGGITADLGDTVALSLQNPAGVAKARYEIYEYPDGFECPDGWTEASNGVYFALTKNGAAAPEFDLPSDADLWGKFMLSVEANDRRRGGAVANDLFDDRTAIRILSINGFDDVAFREGQQFDSKRQWAGSLKKALRLLNTNMLGQYVPVFDVSLPPYNATGDGVTDDSAAFQAAVDAAESAGGGEVFAPVGSYNVPTLELKPNVTIRGAGRGTRILNALWTADGTAGDEIEITAAVARGATTIPLDTTGLAAGDWIRLASCINANSSDAAEWQLGDREADNSYLSEFAQVKDASDPAEVVLYEGTLFPYSDTPGGDTDVSITASVARRVTFHEGGGLRDLHFFGKNGANTTIVQLTWCRGFTIAGCTVDSNDTECQNVRMTYCLDCHVRSSRIVGHKANPSGSDDNPMVMRSCQFCSISDVELEGGNQPFDITYIVDDMTYRGGPSISCGATKCHAFGSGLGGFIDHSGVYLSYFDTCSVVGAERGFRLRGRGSRATNCRYAGRSSAGIGFYVTEAAAVDGAVTDCVAHGGLFGIAYETSLSDYEDLFALIGGGCLVSDNTLHNQATHGIVLLESFASDVLLNPRIVNNTIHKPGSAGIWIESYNNGAIVDGNRIFGIGSGLSGIRFDADSRRLHIGDNYVFGVHASGFALRGAGTSTLLADATTFPGGNADGELYVGRIYTDAAVPITSLIRDAAAYYTPQAAGWGGFLHSISNAAASSTERSTLNAWINGSNGLQQRWKNGAGVNHTIATYLNAGSPEGAVAHNVGTQGAALCFDTTNGALYLKKTGTGNTGWVALAEVP